MALYKCIIIIIIIVVIIIIIKSIRKLKWTEALKPESIHKPFIFSPNHSAFSQIWISR